MKKHVLIFIILLFGGALSAQSILRGTVFDARGVRLAFANITWEKDGVLEGEATDIDGNYSIELDTGIYRISFSYTGYQTVAFENVVLKPNSITKLDAQLSEGIQISSCVVHAKKYYAPLISSDGKDGQTFHAAGARSKMSRRQRRALAKQKKALANNESYGKIKENQFQNVSAKPLSTFSIDVDNAAYSNVRRYLNQGQKPPADAVKIEEMINYFSYDYPEPMGVDPFEIYTEIAKAPWNDNHQLLHIGLQGTKISMEQLPPSNIVFLIDVSGSMQEVNKLPLLKSAFKLLVKNLRQQDKVAIVVYAGSAGLVLPSTNGGDKATIIQAIDNLRAGGSTAGGAGIKLAYKIAKENFIEGGNNRVILATDGDFNVGQSSDDDMETLIVKERESGVFLTCLGFGMGNYKDSKLEILADKGNGNHSYIDNMMEAKKTLVTEFGGTLFTIAKDVKIQIEFNPELVQAYRLIGYENRLLNDEDFNDDTKDAGELGAGHTVTALYEIIPVGVKNEFSGNVDSLKYQKRRKRHRQASFGDELATVKFRYKRPSGKKSKKMVHTIANKSTDFAKASNDFRFAASVAYFGMILRESKYVKGQTVSQVVALAENAKGADVEGYRSEFVRMIRTLE